MSDKSNKPHPHSTPGALNSPDGMATVSVLDYLTGCHPPLDLVIIQTALQELQLSSEIQDEAAAEIRMVWSECRLSEDHRTHERVLDLAKGLARQVANALRVPGRMPRAVLIAAYKETRRTGTECA